MTYHIGDQIIHVVNLNLDILTVLKDCGDTLECFEYNPKEVIIVNKDEVEPL